MRIKFLILFTISSFTYAQEHQNYNDVIWEKSIGGENNEYLFDAIATPDYGFLLIGSSTSNATGDIQKENQGGLDYFIWKMDENGKQEWQQSFGGEKNDFLTKAALTKDGGFILGGYSESSANGDKTNKSLGLMDYWILKLDARGNIQWQKTLGGYGNDELISIIQTKDEGYLLAGNSDSPKSEFKSENSLGGKDYWIIKLDNEGNIIWDKTLGGEYTEEVKDIYEIDNEIVLFGQTNSPFNDVFNDYDWQILRLNNNGDLIDSKRYGNDKEDLLKSIYYNPEKNEFHLAGLGFENENRNLRIISINKDLNEIRNISKEIDQQEIINSIIQTKNGDYLLAGSKLEYIKNKNEELVPSSQYQSLILKPNGEVKWHKTLYSDGFDYLELALETRDGAVVLIGNSDSKSSSLKKIDSNGQQDFWIVKLGNKKVHNDSVRELIEAYPNPTSDFVNILINQEFDNASGKIYNMIGQQLQYFSIKYRTTPIDFRGYLSGTYVIQLLIDGEYRSVKIIKK